MNALFDSAALAIVAYAEVDGATGASTETNSGLVTTKLGGLTGRYAVALPTALAQQANRDLIFVQAKSTAVGPVMSSVDDSGNATKVVSFGNGSTTAVDTSFSILILRTVITPPVGSPA